MFFNSIFIDPCFFSIKVKKSQSSVAEDFNIDDVSGGTFVLKSEREYLK